MAINHKLNQPNHTNPQKSQKEPYHTQQQQQKRNKINTSISIVVGKNERRQPFPEVHSKEINRGQLRIKLKITTIHDVSAIEILMMIRNGPGGWRAQKTRKEHFYVPKGVLDEWIRATFAKEKKDKKSTKRVFINFPHVFFVLRDRRADAHQNTAHTERKPLYGPPSLCRHSGQIGANYSQIHTVEIQLLARKYLS